MSRDNLFCPDCNTPAKSPGIAVVGALDTEYTCPTCGRVLWYNDLERKRVFATLRGSISAESLVPTPTAVSVGTASFYDAFQTTSSLGFNFSLAGGELLVVCVASFGSSALPASVKITGVDCALATSQGTSLGLYGSIWYLASMAGGAASAVATWTGTFPASACIIITKVSGASGLLGSTAAAKGTSNGFSSGTAAVPAGSIAIAVFSAEGSLGGAFSWAPNFAEAQFVETQSGGPPSDTTLSEAREAIRTNTSLLASGNMSPGAPNWVCCFASFGTS